MKNKLSTIFLTVGFLSLVSVLIYGCKKEKIPTPDAEIAFFSTPAEIATYRINTPTTVYKVPVGLTKVPTGQRTVQVTVTPISGAVEGDQYTVSTTTMTFDPNKIVDTIVITGDINEYLTGRRDTLEFTFTNTEDGIPTLSNKFTLAVRGPCLEEDVANEFEELGGLYKQTFEDGSYGPYDSEITGIKAINATSASATVTNIYDNGIEAEMVLDWSTPGDLKITIANQPTGFGVGGLPLYVETMAPGSFNFCDQTFTIPFRLLTSAGVFAEWVTTIAR